MIGTLFFYFVNGPVVLLTFLTTAWVYSTFYISYLLPKKDQIIFDTMRLMDRKERIVRMLASLKAKVGNETSKGE